MSPRTPPRQTAEKAVAGKRYSPEGAGSTLSNDLLAATAGAALGDPTGGLGTAAARRAGGNILTRITSSRYDRLAEATAERLAASGDRRDVFMRELMAKGASRNRLLGDRAATGANLLLDAVGTTYGRHLSANEPRPLQITVNPRPRP